MGDRYYLDMVCPTCGEKEDDVYFAPTCGFVEWVCQGCGHVVDLHKYTGISYEDASNADLIEDLINSDPVELAEKAKKLHSLQ